MLTPCSSCGEAVTDHKDGDVYDVPPWMPEGTPATAMHWRCENEAELAAEDRRQEDAVDAAIRAERSDLL